MLLPKAEQEFIDEDVERRVAAARTVIEIVRTLRERKGIPVKVRIFFDMKKNIIFQYPLKEMVVINRFQFKIILILITVFKGVHSFFRICNH